METLLENLTWTQVEQALQSGTTTVIVPLGATEQHGPHLPLGTDTKIGTELGRRIADRLGDALVAPTLPVGCSHHHTDFEGTLSVPASALSEMLRGYARSLDAHGFEYVVVMPTHGGNFPVVESAAPEIARDLDEASLIPLADRERYMELLNEGLQTAGVDHEEPLVHAGATETAAMYAIEAALVREDAFASGPSDLDSLGALLDGGFDAVTETGVLGEPERATPAAGTSVLEAVAESYAERIRHERTSIERHRSPANE